MQFIMQMIFKLKNMQKKGLNYKQEIIHKFLQRFNHKQRQQLNNM